jgi:hypothetical protein
MPQETQEQPKRHLINGVDIGRVAELCDVSDDETPMSVRERFIVQKVRRIIDKMTKEGYPEST